MSIFNEEQIRQAIENFQRTHPVAFAYDISHIDSEESLEEMKNIIDNYIKKAEKDSEMHIIFEMAKQYLNGARPSYDDCEEGEWKALNPDFRGFSDTYECTNCGGRVMLPYWDRDCDYKFCPWCKAKMEED